MSAFEEKEGIVMTVTEEKKHDYYHDGWVKHDDWYEKEDRRGPYYGEKRWSSDACYARSDDDADDAEYDANDAEYDANDDEEERTKLKIYDLRKIPMKAEDKYDMESDYHKNQLFYESGDDEEDDAEDGKEEELMDRTTFCYMDHLFNEWEDLFHEWEDDTKDEGKDDDVMGVEDRNNLSDEMASEENKDFENQIKEILGIVEDPVTAYWRRKGNDDTKRWKNEFEKIMDM
jgi:hypothetical protein